MSQKFYHVEVEAPMRWAAHDHPTKKGGGVSKPQSSVPAADVSAQQRVLGLAVLVMLQTAYSLALRTGCSQSVVMHTYT